LMAKNQFFYKDVCFKFFSKHPESGEILVLVLNIHYEQTSLSYKILNLFKLQREKIHLNFLGALVKTDLPPNSNSRVHSPNPMVSSGSCGSCGSFLESSSDATNSRDSTD
jgi:hypothetical protein